MLGFVGQSGMMFRDDRKANAFRPAMEPVLYVHPSESASGQVVYRLATHELVITRTVVFSRDPSLFVRELVESPLYLPLGMGGSVPECDYSQRLRGVLVPLPPSPMQVVRHDPVTGLPDKAFSCEAVLGPDDSLLLEVVSPPPDLPPPPLPDASTWYFPDASASPAAPPDPPPSASGGGGPRPDVSYLLRPENGGVVLVVKPASGKRGASAARYAAYRHASCVREYVAAQDAHRRKLGSTGSKVSADLRWDLARGLVEAFHHADGAPHSPLRVFRLDEGPPTLDSLLALERTEPAPVPAEDAPVIHLPTVRVAPHTARYARSLAVLRASLEDDLSSAGPPDPEIPSSAGCSFRPADDLIMSVGGELDACAALVATGSMPPAPSSVREAMRHPEYLAPHGYRAAMQKEILRVERFGAMKPVPASVVRRALRDHPSRTTVAHIVAIFTEKLTSTGEARAPEVLHKFRIAYADSQGVEEGVLTFSSCVDGMTNMVVTAVAPAIHAHQTSIDVGGACYHGTPPSLEEGGRLVFAHMPYWLPGLGGLGYASHAPSGERQFLHIVGNMPGRCDAGRIWQSRFDRFLIGFGLRRLNTDLRVFTWNSPHGAVIIHDHVDDTRITTTSAEGRRMFTTAWALEFGEPLPSEELSEDFTGLRHHRVSDTRTEVSCEGVIRRLIPLLASFPPADGAYEAPLPEDAIRRLRQDEAVEASIR
jgi:hypothetical protein